MNRIIKISILIIYFFIYADLSAQNNPDDVIFSHSISQNIITPVRLCLDSNDNLYASDHNLKSVVKFDATGDYIETIPLDFIPLSITVNEENELFISDKQTGNIYKRKSDGSVSLFYSGCVFPADMEFGSGELLYIVDSKLQQIIILDISGNPVKTIGEGNLIYPTCIAFDKRNQRVLIGEHGGIGTGFTPPCKVWIFGTDGSLIGSFGSYGNADGEFYRIQGITIGNCNNIFVSESYQGNVSVFDENGNFITKFGQYGEAEGDLNVPSDIEFNTKKELIIGSYNKSSIEIFNITETLPTSNIINSDVQICKGESTDINIKLTGTAPWSFTYTKDGLNPTVINTAEENYTLTVFDPGIYEITQLNDASFSGTCFTGSAQIEVSDVNPTANISTDDETICQGDQSNIQINFTGTSPWEFTYTIDGLVPANIKTTNNPFYLSVSDAGLYEITAIEAKGCNGAVFDESYNLFLNPLPTSKITAGNGKVYICDGENVELETVLTGTSPWSITYTVEGKNSTTINNITEDIYTLISPLQGTYEVIEINDANCTNFISEGFPDVVKLSQSIADFEYNIDNDNVTFTNHSIHSDIFHWDFGDGNISAELNPSHSYASSGFYEVSLTSSNSGCEDVFTQNIQINSSSVEELMSDNDTYIYPNPTYGIFDISFKNSNRKLIDIYNVCGKKVFSKQIYSESTHQFDLSGLNSGVYFIRIESDYNNRTYKLILK